MYRDLFMTEEEELKARIEAAKKDLSFFSLYWDDIQNTDWISDEELEEGINDCLDDLNDAQDMKTVALLEGATFSLTYNF